MSSGFSKAVLVVILVLGAFVAGTKFGAHVEGRKASQQLSALKPGMQAIPFTAADIYGRPVSLMALRGKTVVLEWTNHECPYVRKHYESGNMQKTQEKAAELGAYWISVVSSAPGKQGHIDDQKAKELIKERKAKPATVLLDPQGKLGRGYGAKTTPHIYIIDKEGYLTYKGAIDDMPKLKSDVADAENYVIKALEELNAGNPVSLPLTVPYGCSIKY